MRVCDAPDMGIAGFVAETGEAYKAEEAYADARYHAKFDRAWSFQVVHNMCCVPVRIQGSDQPFAVLQAINKDQLACFSAEDEVNMKVSLSTHVLRDTPVTII